MFQSFVKTEIKSGIRFTQTERMAERGIFSCALCNHRFFTLGNFKQHMIEVHELEKPGAGALVEVSFKALKQCAENDMQARITSAIKKMRMAAERKVIQEDHISSTVSDEVKSLGLMNVNTCNYS